MREKERLLFDFIECLDELNEVGTLSEKILDRISEMLENKENVTKEKLLELEEKFIKYECLVKEKYFQYGIKASEVI